jgi:hypothetical protein
MKRVFSIIRLALSNLVMILAILLFLGQDALPPADKIEQIRVYTRGEEFDYGEWMLDALGQKNAYAALAATHYLSADEQKQLVYQTLDLIAEIDRLSYEISKVYADPDITDPAAATVEQRARRDALRAREESMAMLTEAVIQAQVSAVAKDMDLSFLGQPIPPVLYHITPLPYALIVSPRDKIEQEVNISLVPGMTLEERVGIEENVAKNLDKSALVVGIGGVGVYPTMVMSTTDLNWLVEVVSHEWTHNFLTLRPLGIHYDSSPELRTINETTANIAGKEIGREVIRRYYPERLPPEEIPQPEQSTSPAPQATPEPDRFDFRKEMRITRLQVDDLLAKGQIDQAEAYMEVRRKFFWDNGYLIRKLNQAYFAFYGAYNDQPGGAGEAGQDPVGPAVQALRQHSRSLADFLNRISWITSFDGLKKLVDTP